MSSLTELNTFAQQLVSYEDFSQNIVLDPTRLISSFTGVFDLGVADLEPLTLTATFGRSFNIRGVLLGENTISANFTITCTAD